jgi:hypothetical protein
MARLCAGSGRQASTVPHLPRGGQHAPRARLPRGPPDLLGMPSGVHLQSCFFGKAEQFEWRPRLPRRPPAAINLVPQHGRAPPLRRCAAALPRDNGGVGDDGDGGDGGDAGPRRGAVYYSRIDTARAPRGPEPQLPILRGLLRPESRWLHRDEVQQLRRGVLLAVFSAMWQQRAPSLPRGARYFLSVETRHEPMASAAPMAPGRRGVAALVWGPPARTIFKWWRWFEYRSFTSSKKKSRSYLSICPGSWYRPWTPYRAGGSLAPL